jgi:HPt (histidine-containing phosphotransfer) domain-containing protein
MTSAEADPERNSAALGMLVRLGGSRLVGRMIDLWLTTAAERLAAARRASVTGDRQAFILAVHSLKGSAGQLGLMVTRRLSQCAEKEAAEGDLDGIRLLLDEIETELANDALWLDGERVRIQREESG